MGPKAKCKKLVKYGASFPKPLEAVHLPGVAVVKMQPGLPGLPAAGAAGAMASAAVASGVGWQQPPLGERRQDKMR